MKNYRAYEFKDLDKKTQGKVRERFINDNVEFSLIDLYQRQANGEFSKEEFEKELGCTEYYAETTAWFVPGCHYEAHKKSISRDVKEQLSRCLFNRIGTVIDSWEI